MSGITTSADAALRVDVADLRLAFGAQRVLDGVDLQIRQGEFTVLLGPSGTGKTTLLRVLAGLQPPDSGTVLVPERLTFVYQEPRLIPSKRVDQNVRIGLPRTRDVRERTRAVLAEVGLADKARDWPSTLSGGEAQRVALARALVREPQLLILDEPFAALDAFTRIAMQDLVADLIAVHRPAVLLVTHDVDEAVKLADRVLVLKDGGFLVDERVDIPAPRDRGGAAFARVRHLLLGELGVH